MRLSERNTQVSILDFNYYKKYNCNPPVVKGTSACRKKKEQPKIKPPVLSKKLVSCHAKHLEEIISLTCKILENISVILTLEDFCKDPCIKGPSLFDCIMPETCRLIKCLYELMLCTCHNGDAVIECFLCQIKKCMELLCYIAHCCCKDYDKDKDDNKGNCDKTHKVDDDAFDIVYILKKIQKKLCRFKRIIIVHEKVIFEKSVTRKLERYQEKRKYYNRSH